MTYQAFAKLYDELMYDQPYDQWAAITMKFAGSTDRVLDVACGTGSVVSLLPVTMHRVGIDLSEEMLAIANEKDPAVHLLVQNMVEMDIGETFDVITCYCDSLNYLTTLDDVQQFFHHVKAHLASDGTFIFDVHSVWKMQHLFNGQTYSDETDDVTYIWNAISGEEENSVWHEMSFFVNVENDIYQRFDETHYQKTFHPDIYIKLLENAGLEAVQQFADFNMDDVNLSNAERIFFIVKHKR